MKTRLLFLLLVGCLCVGFLTLVTQSVAFAQQSRSLPDDGAEWLAIVETQFVTGTMPLELHRQASEFGGFSTHVVTIDEIATTFGSGVVSPTATKAYLQNAYDTWQVKPKYVVLIGDATFDDSEGVPTFTMPDRYSPTYIPASDHPYALLDGGDIIPELAIGRISVSTTQELSNVISKTIAHDQAIVSGEAWTKNGLVISAVSGGAGNFSFEGNAFLSKIPADYSFTHLALDDYAGSTAVAAAALRVDLFNTINVTRLGTVVYFGTSGLQVWGPQLHTSEDMSRWQNSQSLPIVLDASSIGTAFNYRDATHAETMLRYENGPVAYWGAANLAFLYESSTMLSELTKVLRANGETHLGDAIVIAKSTVAQTGTFDDVVVEGFNLLGDPAVLNVVTSVPLAVSLNSAEIIPHLDSLLVLSVMLLIGLTGVFLRQIRSKSNTPT